MGRYFNEYTESTTSINKNNFDIVLSKIKTAASSPKWKQYGWRNDILRAESFYDVMKEFGIELSDDGGDNFKPIFRHVYVSDFFKDLLNIVTPYMSDGHIIVDDGYTIMTITFKKHQANIKNHDYNE